MISPPAPNPTSGAVFLSYAREDAAAARRIADALRAFGVEVWFDQHELRGGDQWDAKIRQQVRDCRLFVPVISAATESRTEGYFRREWKLAAERTHDMGKRAAFLVPVVIDATPEARADVPDEFLRVQWSRLLNGVPSPEFVVQVKRLLEAPRAADGDAPPMRPSAPSNDNSGRLGEASRPPRRKTAPLVIAGLVIFLMALGGLWLRRSRPAKAEGAPNPQSDPMAATKTTVPGPPAPAVPAKSIAVLPFENLSRDAQNDVFTDGMHDDVITALTKIHDLTVISRTSVMGYKSGTRNLRAVAAELGVAHILEGSVQRDGNRVKLNMQLIDARTDAHVWADHYTGEITDTFTVQATLATAITMALKARFSPEEKALIARQATTDPEAYELYQRARRSEEGGSQRDAAPWAGAIALYEQAIAKDPRFVLAHAKLSEIHGLFYWFSSWDPTPGRREKAKAALDAAERIAPDAPETLVARGVYAYRCENDFERALAHHLAAERGMPNDAQLQDHIGSTLRRLGRPAEASQRFLRAVELDPRALPAAESYALSLFQLRRFADAGRFVEDKRRVFPNAAVLTEVGARSRFALDGDAKACLAALSAVAVAGRPSYTQARRVGDLEAAKAAVNRYVVTGQLEDIDALRPLPLWRAQWAWLNAQRDDARKFGVEALATLSNRTPNLRQQRSHGILVAQALAYCGRPADAARQVEEAMPEIVGRDKLQAISQRLSAAEAFLVAGDNVRALECLRESAAAGAWYSAAELRSDPLWAPLRNDAGFTEALKLLEPR